VTAETTAIYRDPDECPAVQRMQQEVDELRRDVQQLQSALISIREMIEDGQQH
jgi:prefoldin subunit 5